MASHDDIDRMISEHAARWQATVRADATVNIEALRGSASRGPLVSGVIALAAFGVVWAAVAVQSVGPLAPAAGPESSSSPPNSSATSVATPAVPNVLQSSVVGVGDVVVSTGTLVTTGPTDGFICGDVAWAGGPVCARSTGVPIHLSDDALAGHYVRVRGAWDGAAIQADEISAVDKPPSASPVPVSCRAPADGWPGEPSGDDAEAVVQALAAEVDRHPALYVGMWSGVAIGDVGGSVRVLVVGTVGSLEAATADLARVYSNNLCVVAVEFSASDLAPVMSSLSRFEFPWDLRIDPAAARVVVTTKVLTQSMADVIAPFANRIELQTQVTRD